MTRIILTSMLVGAAVGGTAASATTITDIVGNPEGYVGQEVTVVGTVMDPSAGRGDETVYTLSADDLRITVFGRGSAPGRGDRLEVTAKVGWREGDEEFTWPPILLERARRPAP